MQHTHSNYFITRARAACAILSLQPLSFPHRLGREPHLAQATAAALNNMQTAKVARNRAWDRQ